MNFKKSYIFFLTLLLVLTTTLSYAETASVRKPSLLFVLHAKQGEINKVNSQYELVLHNPSVNYFTDRPARQVGHMPVSEFVKNWGTGNNSFRSDHPNVALVGDLEYFNQHKEVTNFTVIEHPKFDEKKQTLSFALKAMEGKLDLHPGNYKNVTLFVDNCTDGSNSIGCF